MMPVGDKETCHELMKLQTHWCNLDEKMDLLIQLGKERHEAVMSLRKDFDMHIELEKESSKDLKALVEAWKAGEGAYRLAKFIIPIIVGLAALFAWIKFHIEWK